MLTETNSKKAVHYSVLWLKQEIQDIEKSIDNCSDIIFARLLNNRLVELKADLKTFEKINNESN